jgi:hypothetical protein
MPSRPRLAALTLTAMPVEGFDERHIVREGQGAHFVVFIYTGTDDPEVSWSVNSYLITDADVPEVLRWLAGKLPTDPDTELDAGTITCWSLGVVRHPDQPTTESDMDVAWVIGADVLNIPSVSRSAHDQRLADEMLARRHRVTLLSQP